jgi:hypothetical protein
MPLLVEEDVYCRLPFGAWYASGKPPRAAVGRIHIW